jgi:mediator of RNA polymerase II transcription subunit 31
MCITSGGRVFGFICSGPPSATTMLGATESAEAIVDPVRQANRERFELELEFVQSLANPFYLQTLAQQNVLSKPTFIRYLKYLMYWKEPEYARFVVSVPHPI